MSTPLDADRAEIERFVEVLFRHAEGGFVSLRSFGHDGGTVDIRPVEINGHGLSPVVAQATGAATRAARHGSPAVFCPPVCTFKTAKGASDADVHEGVSLSVDCDEHPSEARQRLTGILGPATVVVASGGVWTNPETGELQSKVHLHWRLAEPTRDPEGHAKLKRARGLCVALAGGDASGVPLVHPLRWPGSWHRKGKAKLCRGVDYRPSAEIDLDDALEALEGAATLALEHATGREAERLQRALNGRGRVDNINSTAHDPDAHDPDLEALADAIPNDDEPRDVWQNVGLAFYAASEGSAAGFNAWDRWAQKSSKYHQGTFKRWEHFAKSPPNRTGIQALASRAQKVDPKFRLPSWGPAPEPVGPAPQVAKVEARKPGDCPPVPDWSLFTYGEEIVSTKREYLIKGLVNRSDFSAWYGPPKGGKSFVMLDLALHIASGRSWRGRRVRQGRVLYLALEGGFGIRNRIVAAQSKFGTGALPFHLLAVPLNLLNGDGLKLEAFIEAKVDELGGKFDLIVLDTLSRSMPGGKENTPEVMSAVVGVLDRLRDATGAHVAAIHHCGKDEEAGLRGHSSLLGAIDLCVFIRNQKIKVEDARDCEEGDEWGFILKPVTIGQDDEGDDITSCVVEETEAAEKGGDSAKPRRPRGKNQQTVLDAFYKAVSGAADDPPPDPLVPRKACGIWREKWKEAAMPQLTQGCPKQRREAFDDALAHLRDQGFVRHHNGYFWMALGADQ